MSTMTPWEVEKLDLAGQVYAALAAFVGDVERLRLTEASMSWRTPAGVQGHWREERGQLWLGRIVWTNEGRQSEQLVLALPSLGTEAERVRLVHPTIHHCRSVDGPVVGFDPDTPEIYAAALYLLTQLTRELSTMLAPAPEGQEETDHEA